MECTECGSTETIRKGGIIFCKKCGTVLRTVEYSGAKAVLL